ncbi:hypothetical protein OE88DRAFT_1732410 [Heliocybe sulcata]|uniref:Uncharacterized protein n=1 Tax=Heliocybe sulcata TaxID=5364 RepID=A0A5C3NCV2_9AGAM|nr:hypothetical protein OE88DRAFT_1732410 [Heliocybe sulcata]
MNSRRYDTNDASRTGRDHNHERWIPPSAVEQGQRRPPSARHQSYDHGTTADSSRRNHPSNRAHTSHGPSASAHQSSAFQPAAPGTSSGKGSSGRTQQQYAGHPQKYSTSTSRPQMPTSQQSYSRMDETTKRRERKEGSDPHAHYRQQGPLDKPSPHSPAEKVQVTEDSRRVHRSRQEYATASAGRAGPSAAPAPQSYFYDATSERTRGKEPSRGVRDERDRYEDEERARRRRQREEDKLRAKQYAERALQDDRHRPSNEERKREEASKTDSRTLAKSTHATRTYDERFKDSDESDASRRRMTASHGARYPEAMAGTSTASIIEKLLLIFLTLSMCRHKRVRSSAVYDGGPGGAITYSSGLGSAPQPSSATQQRGRGVSGHLPPEPQPPEQGHSSNHRSHRERERDKERTRSREAAPPGSDSERELRRTHHSAAQPEVRGQGRRDSQAAPAAVPNPPSQGQARDSATATAREQQSGYGNQEAASGHQRKGSLSNWLFRRDSTKVSSKNNNVDVPRASEASQPVQPAARPLAASVSVNSTREPVNNDQTAQEHVPAARSHAVPVAPPGLPSGNVSGQARGADEALKGRSVDTLAPPIDRLIGSNRAGAVQEAPSSFPSVDRSRQAPVLMSTPAVVPSSETANTAHTSRNGGSAMPSAADPPVPATPTVVPASPSVPTVPSHPRTPLQATQQTHRAESGTTTRAADVTRVPSNTLPVTSSSPFPVVSSASRVAPPPTSGQSSRQVQDSALPSPAKATPSAPQYDTRTIAHQSPFHGNMRADVPARHAPTAGPDEIRGEGTPPRDPATAAHIPPPAQVDERYRVLPRNQSIPTPESLYLPIPNSTLFGGNQVQPQAARIHGVDGTRNGRLRGASDRDPPDVNEHGQHTQQLGETDLRVRESYAPPVTVTATVTQQQSSQGYGLNPQYLFDAHSASPSGRGEAPTPYHTPLDAPQVILSGSYQESVARRQDQQKAERPEGAEQVQDLVASLNEILSDPFRPSTSAERRSPRSKDNAEESSSVPAVADATFGGSGNVTTRRNGPTSRKKSKEKHLKPQVSDVSRINVPDSGPGHFGQSQPAPFHTGEMSLSTASHAVPRHAPEQVQQPASAPTIMKHASSQSAIVSEQPQASPKIQRNEAGNKTSVTHSFVPVSEQNSHSFRDIARDAGPSETPMVPSSTGFPPVGRPYVESDSPRPEVRTDDKRPPVRPNPSLDSLSLHAAYQPALSSVKHSPGPSGHALNEHVTQSIPVSQQRHSAAVQAATAETQRMPSHSSVPTNGQPVQRHADDPRLRQILLDSRPTPLTSTTVNAAALPSSSRDLYTNDLPLPTPDMPATLAMPYSRNISATGAADYDVTPRQTPVRPPSVKDIPINQPSQRHVDSSHSTSMAHAPYSNTHNLLAHTDSRVSDRHATQQYPASSVYQGQAHPVYPESIPKPELVQHAQAPSLRANTSTSNAARNQNSHAHAVTANVPPNLASRGLSSEAAKNIKSDTSVPPSIPPAPLPAGYGPPQRPEHRSTQTFARHAGQANDEKRSDARIRETAPAHPAASAVPSQLAPSRPSESSYPASQPSHQSVRSQPPVPHPTVSLSTPAVPTLSNSAPAPVPVRSNTDTILQSNVHASSGAQPSHSKRSAATTSASKPNPASLAPPPVNTSRSRESDGLKTPSSLTPNDARTTPAPPLSATPSQDSSKKKSGFFNTLFRTKSNGPSDRVHVDSREIWDHPSQSKPSRPNAARLQSRPDRDPVDRNPASQSAKSSRPSNKVVPPAATRAEAQRPVALQIPVQPSGRKSPAAKHGLFAKILAPKKRYRTVSSASVEANDGTATTVLNSPTASTLSTSPPMIPYRDPWAATQDWRADAEVQQNKRGKERRFRPGVTFDLNEDPPPERAPNPRHPSTPRRRG